MAKLTEKHANGLLDEVRGLFEDAVTATSQRVPFLLENTAFYRGFQWGEASPIGWIESDMNLDEAREVLNYVRPTVRTAVADTLRSLPNPEVVAASGDQRAVARAMASERLIRSWIRSGVIAFEQLLRGETGVALHGGGWYKVLWDPNKGRRTGGPAFEDTTRSMQEDEGDEDVFAKNAKSGAEGEISVQFVDIASAPCDPHARNEGEVYYVCHRKLLPERVLNDWFPVDFFQKPTRGRWSRHQPDGKNHSAELDLLENDGRLHDIPDGGGSRAQTTANQLAELVEYWEKPSNTYPKGRLIVFSGSTIVAMGPLPYGWPWVMRIGQNVLPNGLFPDGVVRDILPIQRTINLNASKKREWMDWCANPWLLVPRGADIDRDMFSDMAGDVIEYNEGRRPEWVTAPDIPPGIFTLEDQAVSVLQTISTYSDISRGEPPQGYDSGRALAYLYEFQKSVHEPDIHIFRRDMARVLQRCLSLARDFYQEGRMVRMIGENNRWMLRTFKNDDYDFEAELVIEAFSGKPNSRALRYAEQVELFQIGALEDTPPAKALRNALDVDAADRETLMVRETHLARARAEQTQLLEDPFADLEVLGQDDHETHLEAHKLFSVTPEFLDQPDWLKGQFYEHIEETEMQLAEQTEAYSAEAAMLSGNQSSPEGGAPPPKEPGQESPANGGHAPYEQAYDALREQTAQDPENPFG